MWTASHQCVQHPNLRESRHVVRRPDRQAVAREPHDRAAGAPEGRLSLWQQNGSRTAIKGVRFWQRQRQRQKQQQQQQHKQQQQQQQRQT